MRPTLFVTVKVETSSFELTLENVSLPKEGLRVVIVTSKEMQEVTLHDGYTLEISPKGLG